MDVKMVITVSYDPAKDGNLAEFRTKYLQYKEHVARMQAAGTLPREGVTFVVKHSKQRGPVISPPDNPSSPARVLGFVPRGRVPVHYAGQRLDMMRMAG